MGGVVVGGVVDVLAGVVVSVVLLQATIVRLANATIASSKNNIFFIFPLS